MDKRARGFEIEIGERSGRFEHLSKKTMGHDSCRETRVSLTEGIMASNRTVYHIVPNASGDRWLITQEGGHSTRAEFETKAEAVEVAKQRARNSSRRK